MDAKAKKMLQMYASGKSLREVGDAFGVSGERVRQVLDEVGYKRRPRGYQPGPSGATKRAVVKGYLTGDSRKALAEINDLSVAEVNRILDESLTEGQVRERNRGRGGGRREYADWEIVEALTACAADLGPKFSRNEYAEWREEQDTDYPSLPLFSQRRPDYAPDKGATWNGWRKIAGLPVSPVGTSPGHARQYDDAAIYTALDEVADMVEGFPTVAQYAKYRPEGAPSANTVRLRFGGWGDVRGFYDERKGSGW